MLYSNAPESVKAGDNLYVVGFVAARIMAVKDGQGGADLTLVLQPCMMTTATAVTEHTRRDFGPRTLFNPYIARVRLVE